MMMMMALFQIGLCRNCAGYDSTTSLQHDFCGRPFDCLSKVITVSDVTRQYTADTPAAVMLAYLFI